MTGQRKKFIISRQKKLKKKKSPIATTVFGKAEIIRQKYGSLKRWKLTMLLLGVKVAAQQKITAPCFARSITELKVTNKKH